MDAEAGCENDTAIDAGAGTAADAVLVGAGLPPPELVTVFPVSRLTNFLVTSPRPEKYSLAVNDGSLAGAGG